jgi:hypothetical protein
MLSPKFQTSGVLSGSVELSLHDISSDKINEIIRNVSFFIFPPEMLNVITFYLDLKIVLPW